MVNIIRKDDIMYNYKDINIINEKAKFYAKELWDMSFDLPIDINTRLRSTYAWYIHDEKIQLNKNYIYMDEYFLDDTLLHELCHWYCHTTGKLYDDFTRDFEQELRRIGASSTETSIFAGDKYLVLYDYHTYTCEICGNKIETKDYLEDKVEGEIGRKYKIFQCCNSKMKCTNYNKKGEDFIPNDKILSLNSRYKEYLKSEYNKSA
jgi:predicted SprT family Zn-dependent metalloprotease